MAANLLESRLPPTTAGRSWWCGPVLNLLKDMLSPKLLVELALRHSPAKTGLQPPKSTLSAAHSEIASFCPFAEASGPHHRLTAFSHWKQWFCFC
jgi:hypothetical protein